MPFAIKPKQKVLFIGDSITDCGRRDANAPLGNGYVKFCHDLIMARYPAHQLSIINKGISGDTLYGLMNRWSDDVIKLKPDWVSIKIGINDLHRVQLKMTDIPATPEDYAGLFDTILSRTRKELGAQIVLMDPFFVSDEKSPTSARKAIRDLLPQYTRTVGGMARKYKTRHVKTEQIFQNLLKYYPADYLCPEPVHPYANGHLVMAHAWLNEVGW